jgi:multiple sugar transport system permease protein
VAGLCAYPLSRYQMKQKKLFMYSVLFMTSLPITALMVPVYQLFITVKLYDNIFGVILFLTASALPIRYLDDEKLYGFRSYRA